MIKYKGHKYAQISSDWEVLFDWLTQNSMVYDDELADLPREEVKEFHYQEYVENRATLLSLDGQECWRAIGLPQPTDPAEINPLGVYWSWVPEGAEPYWSEDDKYIYTFRGRVDLRYLDFDESLKMQMINPEEYEIRFYENSPIYIYDVELPDFTETEINDWRRT